MRSVRRDEPSGRRAEHELEHLSPLATHFQTPAVVAHRLHDALLEAPAEVRDPCPRTDAREWPGGTEHSERDASAARPTHTPAATDTLS
jgi:hypothetical protein